MRSILSVFMFLAATLQAQIPAAIIGGTTIPNTPVDSPGAGTYSSTQSVTLTDTNATAIFYTLTGTAPNCIGTSGTLYTGAFNITVTTTLKAIGCNGVTGGGVLTSVYTISGSEPTFTHIQGKAGAPVSSGTTFSVTLSSAPTNGNAVVCYLSSFPTSLSITVTDGNAKSYTASAASPKNTQGSAESVWLFYLLSASGASATITATANGTISFNSLIKCDEFNRSSGTWMYDLDASASGTTSPVTTPSITPSLTGELLFYGVSLASSANCSTAGSPWTVSAATQSSQLCGAYNLASSGSVAPNLTLSSNAAWNSINMALK